MIYGDERNINAVVIASVTEAPKHIDGIGIKETHINEQGHLIITYTDGRVADAGEIVKASAVAPIVNNWLDEHPEATTTVEDGSITEAKIAPLFLPVIKTTIDNTLSMSGAAAEAEAVGDEVERLDGRIDNSVHTNEQDLTAEQQAQVRENIGIGFDSGSYYTKLPDGTLIQWGTVEHSITQNTETTININYPIAFKSTPFLIPAVISSYPQYFTITSKPGSSNTVGLLMGYCTSSSFATIYFDWIAIGRWK